MIITGIGRSIPTHRVSQQDAAGIVSRLNCDTAAQERLFETLYRRAGVQGRNCVVLDRSDGPREGRQSFYTSESPTTLDRMRKYEEKAGPLALTACKAALESAAISPRRVTHLVTVSCTGFFSPGFDIYLLKNLPLSSQVARTHVGFMGCHGALNGLRLAHSFVGADPSACVLLCTTELCSLHHQYGWNAERVVANALFGDGSAAVVGMHAEERRPGQYRVLATGSIVIDDSEDVMAWRLGNHGFEMTISPRVPGLIREHLRPWLENWLTLHGLDVSSVYSWAIHPGGPRVLAAVTEALGLDQDALDASRQVLAEQGNMSSTTILFILDRLRGQCADGPCVQPADGPCVALAFGPGLCIEAALLD